MTEHEVGSAIQNTKGPFPPSWIDRLVIWINHLPVPTWVLYLMSILTSVFLVNAVFWIDGSMSFGSVEVLLTIFSLIVFYWLALYHYLTRVGSQSLQTFRPLLPVDDSEFTRIAYELATLPRWLGRLAIPLGLGLAAATILGDTEPFGEIVPRTLLPYAADIVVTGFLASIFLCLIIRSVRQLRMVSKLHARATNINLLKLESAHAFSALTARTGMGIILLLVFSYFLDPLSYVSTLDIATAMGTLFVAVAVFVLPIIGIRNQLEDERQRVVDKTSDLLQTTYDRMHIQVQSENYQYLRDMKDAIEVLIKEREMFGKISTWPWDPRTIRGFGSTLLLPVFLWLVTRLLERLI